MDSPKLTKLHKQSNHLIRILNIAIGIFVLFFIIHIIIIIKASFLPTDAFTVKRGIADWSVSMPIKESMSYSVLIPTPLFSVSGVKGFNAKAAFFSEVFIYSIIFIPILMYGFDQVKKILYSTIQRNTPFTFENAKRIKRVAYAVIAYALFGKLLQSIFLWLFATKIFSFTLTEISVSGIGIGGLLVILAQMFSYGVHIQHEYDTTV